LTFLYPFPAFRRPCAIPARHGDREKEWLAMAERDSRILYEQALLRSANPTHALSQATRPAPPVLFEGAAPGRWTPTRMNSKRRAAERMPALWLLRDLLIPVLWVGSDVAGEGVREFDLFSHARRSSACSRR
jgi:hypothetical protein